MRRDAFGGTSIPILGSWECDVHDDVVARMQGEAFGQIRISPLGPEGQVNNKGTAAQVRGGALSGTRLGSRMHDGDDTMRSDALGRAGVSQLGLGGDVDDGGDAVRDREVAIEETAIDSREREDEERRVVRNGSESFHVTSLLSIGSEERG